MSIVTYRGTLRKGKVEFPSGTNLPEGSEVYVIANVGIDERTAKKIANGWLIDHVGNMVMAGNGTLIASGDKWLWRFSAYLTGMSHDLYGPIGYVDVDAATSAIITDPDTVEMMYKRGEHFVRPT